MIKAECLYKLKSGKTNLLRLDHHYQMFPRASNL